MDINWKLRFKNKYTLTALISTTALFVNQVLSAFGVDYSEQIKQIVDACLTLVTLLVALGIVINFDREREKESKKERDDEMKKLKWSIFGLVGTLATSLLVAAIRMLVGI